ncbi:Zn(II)2Cys6 transcription factor [Aspergillus glaucus CBS 516.65]|uniref:Zn(2)-C6 fungal-type domain-containing protein n=1 Tax=Aspergillus glaucus CBS 516.65 TaxID=1160497 RepID=A0A1L9VSE0_ASPGL|nr:hypothetical protein ASPGLDRAFT_121463 [Aspergillus glaucus CBS 516.65]OJJ86831.1 hypothetical protein ASPGLDRAFT_121463 [Aspergillus glaucus CBS 516.65]
MPRPRRPGAPEPKRRSRNGCWPCKSRKVKCGEEKPSCINCRRQNDRCDYSIKLNWEGRTRRKSSVEPPSPVCNGSTYVFSSVSPPAFHQSLPSVSEDILTGAAENILWEERLSHIDPGTHNRDHSESQKPLSSVPQLAGVESPVEINDLLQVQDVAISWADNSPHSSSIGSTLNSTPSLLNPIEDGSYPSPAETDSAFGGRFFNRQSQNPSFPSAQQAGPASNSQSPSGDIYYPGIPIDFLLDKPEDHEEDRSLDLSTPEKRWHAYLRTVTDNYGLDYGRPDLDLNKNDDHAAIDVNRALQLINPQWNSQGDIEPEMSFVQELKSKNRTYYDSPVPVNIPRYLSPLPMNLLKNPINLMYFHHFLSHTAKMLVPHDCGDNPFVSVLPSMAIADSNLLNLTLAYSASHRARYLGHAEPANRIADWVSDVFPALRYALDNPHTSITDSHLATAVMLLSLKIISPSTFEVPIPWQSHLSLARGLFQEHAEHMAYPGNRIGAFLARWLGYIDIMGTLSCRDGGPPLDMYYSVMNACSTEGEHDEFSVDCFTGFSPRTGACLIRLGKLVHRCDNECFDDVGMFRLDWTASVDMILEAKSLVMEFEALRTQVHVNGKHYRGSPTDLLAMDRAFCCSALLHLHRRILGSSLFSPAVHEAQDGLLKALAQIEPGGSTEVGALFPLFTAGCEVQDTKQRMEILERFVILETTGMKQIQNARRLMQRCWDEDLPWIALAKGEFLG